MIFAPLKIVLKELSKKPLIHHSFAPNKRLLSSYSAALEYKNQGKKVLSNDLECSVKQPDMCERSSFRYQSGCIHSLSKLCAAIMTARLKFEECADMNLVLREYG